MFKSRWSLAILVFLVGFLVSWILNSAVLVSGATTEEQLSPSDRVREDQIYVYEDKVVLEVPGATWASFSDTNSMDPILDKEANALQLIPRQSSDIQVGDIISYTNSQGERIIHRVVYKGTDNEGVYFIVKGDNNKVSDPGKVRFDQIDRVLFAIIW